MLPTLMASAAEFKPYQAPITARLELGDLDGREHTLADYRGKVVLVSRP